MYSVEVQMLCCSAECVDGLECQQLFEDKEEARAHMAALKRQIRTNSCCSKPLMMIEAYEARANHFTLTVATPADQRLGALAPLPRP